MTGLTTYSGNGIDPFGESINISSVAFNNSPVTPFSIISGIPSIFVANTGVLHKPASRHTFPSGSRI